MKKKIPTTKGYNNIYVKMRTLPDIRLVFENMFLYKNVRVENVGYGTVQIRFESWRKLSDANIQLLKDNKPVNVKFSIQRRIPIFNILVQMEEI